MINLAENHEISGFWTVYTEDASHEDLFGILLYEAGEHPRVKFTCKSDHPLVDCIFKRNVHSPIAVGLTDYGVCYCHDAFWGDATRRGSLAEFFLHVNNAFFVDKLSRVVGEEYQPHKVESLQDNSFTECRFSLLGADNLIYKTLLSEGWDKAQKEFDLIINDELELTVYVGSTHSHTILGHENITNQIYFNLKVKNKNITETINIVQSIKHSFAFLCNDIVFIKEISLYRHIDEETIERCHLIFRQNKLLPKKNSLAWLIKIDNMSSLKDVFTSTYSICNIDNFKLFETLENFNHDEIIESASSILNALDESYKIIIDITDMENKKKGMVEKIKSAINFDILDKNEEEFILNTLDFAKNIKLRDKIKFIFRQAKESGYFNLSSNKIASYSSILCDARIATSHGRVFHRNDTPEKQIEKLIQARDTIFAAVYTLLLEKIGISQEEIMNFLANNFGWRPNRKKF